MPDATVDFELRLLNQKQLERRLNSISGKKYAVDFDINEKSFRQPLGRITGDVNEFEKSLNASNARVLAFGASTAVIAGVTAAFSDLVTQTIEVEATFADINRILNLTTKNFEKFSDQLFDTGQKTASTFRSTADAALEFARQGLGVEESLKRTSDALTLVRLTGLNAKKSVDLLTATVNAFNLDDSTAAVDKFVNVETQFAVSARDLVEGLSRVGSSAVDAKVDLDELNAAITAVQQSTGRGGAVIGNAFKTIFTRLQRTSTLEALERFNVEVRDIEGNILPAITILNNFARSYEGLADSSKSYLREQVAGVFQANILSAILKDLNSQQSVFNKSLIESRSAAGEAAAANERLNTALSALLSQTGLELTELQSKLGDLIFVGPTKQSIEILKNGLQEINNSFANVGEDSETIGDKFIQGFLKGIRNVIQGPVLAGAFVLLYKLLQNTGTFLKDIIPSVTGIKTETQQIANTQSLLNEYLRQNKISINDIFSGNQKVEDVTEAILSKIKLENTEYEKQEQLVKNIATQINKRGLAISPIGAVVPEKGLGPKIRGTAAEGYTPGILREQAAIEKGVGKAPKNARPVIIPDFKFANGQAGPLVANTSEYLVPNFDGKGGMAIFNQEMVDKYGIPNNAISLDQKSKLPQSSKTNRQNAAKKDIAARGYIPNAASSTFFSDLRQSGTGAKIGKNPSIFKAADESVSQLIQKLTGTAISAEKMDKEMEAIAKQFDLSRKSTEKLKNKITAAVAKAETALSFKGDLIDEGEISRTASKSKFSSGESVALKGFKQNEQFVAERAAIIEQYRIGRITEKDLNRETKKLIAQKALGLSENQRVRAETKELINIARQDAIVSNRVIQAKNALIEKYKRQEISEELLRAETQKLIKTKRNSDAARKRLNSEINREILATKNSINTKNKFTKSFSGGVGLGIGFGIPLAAGIVEQNLFGGKQRTSLTSGERLGQGVLSSGVSLASTGAGIGGISGGPIGAAIGGTIGGLIGLALAVNNTSLTFEELTQISQNYAATTQQVTGAAYSYIDAQERLSKALAQGDQKAFADAQKSLADNFEKIKGTELEKSFSDAGRNVDELIRALGRYEKERNKTQILKNTAARAKKFDFSDTESVEVPGVSNLSLGALFSGGAPERLKQKIKVFGEKSLEEASKDFQDFFEFFRSLPDKDLGKISKASKIGVSELSDVIISLNQSFGIEDLKDLESLIGSLGTKQRVALFSNIRKILNEEDDSLEKQKKENKALLDSYLSVLEGVKDSSRILSRVSDQTGLLEKYTEAFVGIQDVIGAAVKEAETVKVTRDFDLKQAQLDFSQQRQSIDFATKNAESLTKLLKTNTVSSESAIRQTRKSINEFINNPQEGLASIKKAIEDGVFELSNSGNLDVLLSPIKDLQTEYDLKQQNFRVEQNILDQRRQIEVEKAKNLDLESKLKFENESASLSRELEFIRARGQSERNIRVLERDRTELGGKTGFSPIERARQEASIERRIFNERQKVSNIESDNRILDIQQQIAAEEALIKANSNLLKSNSILTEAIFELTKAINEAETEEKVNQEKSKIPNEVRRRIEALLGDRKILEAPEVFTPEIANEAFKRTRHAAFQNNPQLAKDFFLSGPKNQKDIDEFNNQFRTDAFGYGKYAQEALQDKVRKEVEGEFEPRLELIRKSSKLGAEELLKKHGDLKEVITEYTSLDSSTQQRNLELLNKRLKIAIEEGDIRKQNALEELKLNLELAALQAKRAQSFKVGFGRAFGEFETESFTFVNQIGYDIPRLFRDGMVDALNTAMDRAEDLEDALRQSAVGFLTEIRNGLNKQAVNNLLSGLGNAFNFSDLQTRQSGGVIRAQNGMYISGSRTGDKNPALLEDGEYVLNRNAVRALGGASEIDKFNFGIAPRFNSGGRAFLNENIDSSRLSGLFLSGDNPELAEAREAFAEKMRRREEKRQKRTALRNLLISTAASSVLSIGSGLVNRTPDAGKFGAGTTKIKLNGRNAGVGDNLPATAEPKYIYSQQGGNIGKYAKKRYGGAFNNKLTGGYIGYQSGGSVAESAPLGSTGGGNMNNNVRININMNNDGSVAASVSSDSNGGEDQATKAKRLGIELEAAVQKVLAKERRVGGAFHEGGRRK